MSKNIWHNKKEKPTKKLHCNRIIITKWGSCLDEIDIDNGATIETDWAFLDDLLALETELKRTRIALDKGMEHITGLNNMIESWYKLLQSDKDTSTKYAILKSAISAYVENKGDDNE